MACCHDKYEIMISSLTKQLLFGEAIVFANSLTPWVGANNSSILVPPRFAFEKHPHDMLIIFSDIADKIEHRLRRVNTRINEDYVQPSAPDVGSCLAKGRYDSGFNSL